MVFYKYQKKWAFFWAHQELNESMQMKGCNTQKYLRARSTPLCFLYSVHSRLNHLQIYICLFCVRKSV